MELFSGKQKLGMDMSFEIHTRMSKIRLNQIDHEAKLSNQTLVKMGNIIFEAFSIKYKYDAIKAP